MGASLLIIDQLLSALVGFLNVIGATKVVSDIIAARIASGRTTWTDAERSQITSALDAAKAKADAQITAAGAPPLATTARMQIPNPPGSAQ